MSKCGFELTPSYHAKTRLPCVSWVDVMLELLSNLNGMWKCPWWLIWFWPFLVLENWKKKEKGLKDVSWARSSWKFIWHSPSVGWKEVN